VYRGVPKRTCGLILGDSSRESEGAASARREIKNDPVRWIFDLRVGRSASLNFFIFSYINNES
jgi:hypothetical protein